MFSFIFFIFSFLLKNEIIYKAEKSLDPFILYEEGLEAFQNNEYFYANKKFSQAELNFKNVDLAAKSAIMSSFALYGINFYEQANDNLVRFLRTYPSDKNVIYAHYLQAIIFFEQISDEKRLETIVRGSKENKFFRKVS